MSKRQRMTRKRGARNFTATSRVAIFGVTLLALTVVPIYAARLSRAKDFAAFLYASQVLQAEGSRSPPNNCAASCRTTWVRSIETPAQLRVALMDFDGKVLMEKSTDATLAPLASRTYVDLRPGPPTRLLEL